MAAMNQSDLQRRLENIVRTGTVEAVDLSNAAAPRIRVRDGVLLTAWLPFGTANAGSTRTWNPPSVGEQVVMLSPSGDLAAAVVVCGLFCAANPAPSTNPNEHITTFPDGARMKYNDKTGALVFEGMKTVLFKASASITLDAPQVTATDKLTSNGALTSKGPFTYQAGMSGQGGEGGKTTITGSFTQSGGALSSNGVTLDDHAHERVKAGPDNSGGPVK